jgi:hypothetical protein
MNDGHADQRTFVGEPGPPKAVSWLTRSRPPVSTGRRVAPSRHREQRAADAAGVKLGIKSGRHYTASQLLVGGFDLRNTAEG